MIQKRWYWDVLEPEEGELNYAIIDSVLEKADRNRQQLNFRVMCQNVKMRIPKWAKEAGVAPPYYDNPVFLKKQENLIKALAARYDDDSRVLFVDIGTVGQWGEWHTGGSDVKMPSDDNIRKIIDLYVDNFKKTSLTMLIGAARGPGLEYAVEKGAAWRADCWGDMGDNWKHMEDFYPNALKSISDYDAWKHAPVALETCWTMQEWYDQGWDIDYILSKALEWHATEVNNGTEEIPKEWWPKVQEFEKKLGYRFVLNSLEYPSRVASGDSLDYKMTWENKGVAPIYQEYPVAFRFQSIKDTTQSQTIEIDEDITEWMPGSKEATGKIKIPKEMLSGTYKMYIGLIDPKTKKPIINLAIAGKTAKGWYPLETIEFTN